LTFLSREKAHYTLGNIRFDLAIPMAAGALVGAQLGAKLSLEQRAQ